MHFRREQNGLCFSSGLCASQNAMRVVLQRLTGVLTLVHRRLPSYCLCTQCYEFCESWPLDCKYDIYALYHVFEFSLGRKRTTLFVDVKVTVRLENRRNRTFPWFSMRAKDHSSCGYGTLLQNVKAQPTKCLKQWNRNKQGTGVRDTYTRLQQPIILNNSIILLSFPHQFWSFLIASIIHLDLYPQLAYIPSN